MFNYDEVLNQCPFFKEFIDQHINMEISKVEAVKDAKIVELENTIKQQDNAIMELTTIVDTMGGI